MSQAARSRAPIAIQLLVLIGACLVVTQLVVFATIVLHPPPRPPVYRVAEIAAALKGGPLTARYGRPMQRSVVAAPPPEGKRDPERERGRGPFPPEFALAATLGQPVDAVRLVQRPPGLLDRAFGAPSGGRRLIIERTGEIRLGHRPHGARRETRQFFMGAGPGGPFMHGDPDHMPPEMRLRVMSEIPVFGDFTAALRQADGRWAVVRSSPEPFPTEWQRRALILLVLGFGVVAPAAYLFARRITAPLKLFAEAAERLGRDPHAPQMALSGPAEIGAAAEAFNNMQARVKRYIDDRTAMVGAISHDLRTPLARIRFKLEAAPEGLKGSVLSDVEQMEQMIGGVLTFIRDEGTPRTRERLDLLSLLECVVDDAAMVGGDVVLAEAAPVIVEGDPVALQRLFVNLVDTAVKYGRQARVSVREAGGYAVVEVADAGPGLSADDLERVFQPFYRADLSRNQDNAGIGLGLPIARSTARAHGGDVELVPGETGLIARVTLPLRSI